jgi:hypothetical protein
MASRVSTKDLTDAIREHAATEWAGSRAAQIVNETTDRELAAMAKPARTIPAAIRKVTETVHERVDEEERQSDAAQGDLNDPEPTFEERVAAEGSYPTVDPDAIVTPDGMTEDTDVRRAALTILASPPAGDDVDDLLAAHPAPETPAEVKPLTPREKKYALAQALLTAAANMIDGWDDAGEEITQGITQDDARTQFAGWLAYVPRSGAWDSRLGTDPRPGK